MAKKSATKNRKTATKKSVKAKTRNKNKNGKSMKSKARNRLSAKVMPSKMTLVALAGQMAPEFALPATGGRTISLASMKGKPIVLYFYPRDATPGCTIEGHDFSRLYDQFKNLGAVVLGISRDSMKSHEKFRDCEGYKFDLVSDEDGKACKLFGVIKMKNMYGKKVRGIERSTFVIDREGKVVKEWRGVKVPGHAEEVLNFVQSMVS